MDTTGVQGRLRGPEQRVSSRPQRWIGASARTRVGVRGLPVVRLACVHAPALYILYTPARGAIVDWYPDLFVNPRGNGGYLLETGDVLAVRTGIIALIVATTAAGNHRRGALA
jgi:hypothetical protein